MKSIIFSSIALFALSGQLLSQPLETGDTIPDTTLRDASGAEHKLQDLVKDKPAVLIFYRGGWCPFCTKHLAALADIEQQVRDAGHQILAISPDQPSELAETPDRDQLGYRLLSDSGMETTKAFGIAFQVPADRVAIYKSEHGIDLEAASGETHHMLPHPAVYVAGSDGVIRFAHVNEDFKVRLEPEKIIEVVNGKE